MSATVPLTRAQMEVLEFERLSWKYLGAKQAAIFERFDMSLTRYSQLVNHIISLPAAEVYDPTTVRRLRRVKEQQRASRDRRALPAAAGGAR